MADIVYMAKQVWTDLLNAIRAKGGTSALMTAAQAKAAVQAIPTGTTPAGTKQISITANGTTTEDVAAYANAEITVNVSGGGGGTNYLNYAKKVVFEDLFPSAVVDISLPEATALDGIFAVSYTASYTSIKITFAKQITNMSRAFYAYRAGVPLTSVELVGDTSTVTNWGDCFYGQMNLVEIKGSPLDFTSATVVTAFGFGNANRALTSLEYIRFVPSTIKKSISFINCTALTNASIVSIANGLYAGAFTLTLSSSISDKLSTIYGTVSDGVFTETGNSSDTTLLSFITSTKGWTIA